MFTKHKTPRQRSKLREREREENFSDQRDDSADQKFLVCIFPTDLKHSRFHNHQQVLLTALSSEGTHCVMSLLHCNELVIEEEGGAIKQYNIVEAEALPDPFRGFENDLGGGNPKKKNGNTKKKVQSKPNTGRLHPKDERVIRQRAREELLKKRQIAAHYSMVGKKSSRLNTAKRKQEQEQEQVYEEAYQQPEQDEYIEEPMDADYFNNTEQVYDQYLDNQPQVEEINGTPFDMNSVAASSMIQPFNEQVFSTDPEQIALAGQIVTEQAEYVAEVSRPQTAGIYNNIYIYIYISSFILPSFLHLFIIKIWSFFPIIFSSKQSI